jgi:general secretion pathway protein I
MRTRRGFTLLEAVVALAILAIGLAATMRALGVATLATAEIQSRQMAEWVAQNRLAELRVLRLFPNEGKNEGEAVQGDQEFRWVEEIKSTPNPLFRRVEITVFASKQEAALAQATGFVVRPL